MTEEKIKKTTRIEWHSGEQKDFFDFSTWMFTLGQIQKDIEKCRQILEEIINEPGFDEEKNPKDKKIHRVFFELQLMEHEIQP